MQRLLSGAVWSACAASCSTWRFSLGWSQCSLKLEDGTGPQFPQLARPTSGSKVLAQTERDQRGHPEGTHTLFSRFSSHFYVKWFIFCNASKKAALLFMDLQKWLLSPFPEQPLLLLLLQYINQSSASWRQTKLGFFWKLLRPSSPQSTHSSVSDSITLSWAALWTLAHNATVRGLLCVWAGRF